MCKWMCMGRLLAGDPVFEEKFISNPLEVSRQLGASRAQAQGFAAMGAKGVRELIKQMESIRSALGPELTKLIAGDVGVQMVMGHALADSHFAARLHEGGEAVTTEILGKGKSAADAAAVAKSTQFARLNGFAAQRRAMSGIGKQFFFASAMEGAKTALRDLALEQIREEVRAEMKKT